MHFFKERPTIRVANTLDPDQAWRFVSPDLETNCLQSLLADDKSHHQHQYSLSVGFNSSASVVHTSQPQRQQTIHTYLVTPLLTHSLD